MRNLFSLLAITLFISSIGSITGCTDKNTGQEIYGDSSMTADGAVPVSQIPEMLKDRDSVHIKVEGTIAAVCQKKGCWMEVQLSESENMMVSFKDYDFFVPMNAGWKQVIMEGFAYVDTTSVAQLRHLASDANKSPEEIEAITEPRVSYNFEASGVIIR